VSIQAFSGLFNLQKLHVIRGSGKNKSSDLHNLQAGLFSDLVNLRFLDLTWIEFEAVDDAAFPRFRKIALISLTDDDFSKTLLEKLSVQIA
jgi:hypothetical protein